MNSKDALAILNIQAGYITSICIKAAYRKATTKYHPDHNPAGLEMMKLINVAYETLKDYEGTLKEENQGKNYGEAINKALNAVIKLGLDIEICGVWVWISGDTLPHRKTLKASGYMWAPKKLRWYFRPEKHKSFNRSSWSMEKIHAVYGRNTIKDEQKKLHGAHKESNLVNSQSYIGVK